MALFSRCKPWARKRKWRPSGKNNGQRWLFSWRDSSRVVSCVTSPPVADTRYRGPKGVGEKTTTESRLQEPPLGSGASATVWAGPPEISVVFSFPSAKKPIERESGDQKETPRPKR